MADLNLRIGRDVLTIADNTTGALKKTGLDIKNAGAMTLLLEPEVIKEILILDAKCGAQCVVVNSIDFAPLELRRQKVEKNADELLENILNTFKDLKIQHPLIRIFPSHLPLDISSKANLKEHCDEYKFVARLFDISDVDGFLLQDFSSISELKCALTAIRMVSDKPIIFSRDSLSEDERCERSDDKAVVCADFGCCTDSIALFDAQQFVSIDELLDATIKSASQGYNFLKVDNGSSAKTAAVAALTNGFSLEY